MTFAALLDEDKSPKSNAPSAPKSSVLKSTVLKPNVLKSSAHNGGHNNVEVARSDGLAWYQALLSELLAAGGESADPIQQLTIAGVFCAAVPSSVADKQLLTEWVAPLLVVGARVLEVAKSSSRLCLCATVLRGVLRRVTLLREEGRLRKLSLGSALAVLHRCLVPCFKSTGSRRARQYLAALAAEMVWLLNGVKEAGSLWEEMQRSWAKVALGQGLPTDVVVRAFVQVPLAHSSAAALELLAGQPPAIISEGLGMLTELAQRQRHFACSHKDVLLLMESTPNVEVARAGCRCVLAVKPNSSSSTMRITRTPTSKWSLTSNKIKRCQYLLLHDMLHEWSSSPEVALLLTEVVFNLMVRQLKKKKELNREGRAVVNAVLHKLVKQFCFGEVDIRFRVAAAGVVVKVLDNIFMIKRQDPKLADRLLAHITAVLPHLILDEEVQLIRMPLRYALQRAARRRLDNEGQTGVSREDPTLPVTTNHFVVLVNMTDVSLRTVVAGLCGVVNSAEVNHLGSVQVPNVCAALPTSDSPFEDELQNCGHSDGLFLNLLMQLTPPISRKMCAWDDEALVKATAIIADDIKNVSRTLTYGFPEFRAFMDPAIYPSLVAGKCLDQLLGIPGSVHRIDF
ncbi:hypothetical protein GNI_075330 [Gregarina niphandrodes]|uniref:Uncharacterized protein n=1 Tax=Gregarina niphandrodes TaxID=110365 RepID=A0A023B6Y6_GRENI|nr:hypothetical protein GNI_075330 [Gregarina niphandrodes]EZG66817.1 hypothetical protein GNI_075330 [Gregarina niphandrodes]|eukprot:XP_011130476.1 hypothetical protein GNI_075330 [Gregarina niphandrodes]